MKRMNVVGVLARLTLKYFPLNQTKYRRQSEITHTLSMSILQLVK
jgi:hypothetical protein